MSLLTPGWGGRVHNKYLSNNIIHICDSLNYWNYQYCHDECHHKVTGLTCPVCLNHIIQLYNDASVINIHYNTSDLFFWIKVFKSFYVKTFYIKTATVTMGSCLSSGGSRSRDATDLLYQVSRILTCNTATFPSNVQKNWLKICFYR